METSSATTIVQPPWESVEEKVDPKPESTKPTSYGMRRSCEPCRRRKKKCEGGLPCRRCLRNREECTYSMRTWHQPHAHQQQSKEHQQQEQPRPPSCRGQPTQVLQHLASGAILGHSGLLRFKRCRLSASPATGLVGTQENSFLSDFFGCVGFLPLATQSHIRETMVKIMLSPAYPQQSVSGDGCAEVKQPDALTMGGGFCNAFGCSELHVGPSACIFWSAVALGALVRGSPIESVAGYSHLATEALAGCFGPTDTGILKAWTILAYLHGFMGNEAKFSEYLTLADDYLSASAERISIDVLPVGFAEMIENKEKGKSSRCSMEAAISRDRAHPQLSGGASEHELYRYVMRSFQAFEHAIYVETLKTRTATFHEPGSADGLDGEDAGDQPHGNGSPQPQDISDAMASVFTQGNIVQFGPLTDAADIPSVREGIGGMLINGYVCRYLGFEAAGRGDVSGTLKRFGRCVEVFSRYPGLCRSIMGVHEVHMMLAGLAALDDDGAREMYDTLRAAYNPIRLRGMPAAPPLEDWPGISCICENLYCRAMGEVIHCEKMTAFTRAAGGADACDVGGNEDKELCATQIASATLCQWPHFSHSRKEVNEEYGVSSDVDGVCVGNLRLCGLAPASPETLLAMPVGLSEETAEGLGDNVVAADDWLEASLALLDGQHESDQARSR